MNIKESLKKWIPPIAYDIWKNFHIQDFLYYFNEYENWNDAQRDSMKHGGNYENLEIVNCVNEAVQKVRNGEAAYEQDGVCYYEKKNNWELLSSLFYVNSMLEKVSVLDMGGSLGSTWFRYKDYIKEINVDWCIVEQKTFVDKGKETIPELEFFYSIDEVFASGKNPNVLLLSSVLMYLEEPYTVLANALKYGFEYIIVDETAFLMEENARDKIVLQHVPESLYSAIYPAHLFGVENFREFIIGHGYSVEWEWIYSGGSIPIKTIKGFKDTIDKGFLIKKKAECMI